jgi:hypothetical protein
LYRYLFVLLLILSAFTISGNAQLPVNYFRNPLGIPMDLSANFGELRSDHWHMGLDIRTNQKENLPVYAAADGYISHIGVRPRSFGRFIIITHPNGLSTLYAHLNDFFPELEKYVTDKQYEKESWAIELDFTSQQFPVNKGAFIAHSGNTGGSQGPHLHFEIFDTKSGKRLNPLLFNFPMQDNVPPAITRLAVYNRSKSVYDQTPLFYSLKKTDSGYIIPKLPVMKTGLNKLSFAIQAYDRMSSGGGQDGIYMAKLFLDNKLQLQFKLDSIDYDETGYINSHIDYLYKYKSDGWYQHLSQLPGDKGAAYKKINGDGVIILNDTLVHTVNIEVKDAKGHTAFLHFQLQYVDSIAPIAIANDVLRFAPNHVNTIQKPSFEMFLPAASLYDTIKPTYSSLTNGLPNAYSAAHQVGDAGLPLHEDLLVRIKLNKPVPEKWQDRLLIVRTDNKNKTIKKGVWQGQWLCANFGDFGTYQVLADTLAPQLSDPGKGDTINLSPASRIVFTPTDNFGIKKFRASLDGKWLRFTNDKSRTWIYKFDEHFPYGVYELKVSVEDLAGNVMIKKWWVKRQQYTPPPPVKKTIKKIGATKKKKK